MEARRRFEVFEQLLREGEMCSIAADALGGGEGVLMGRRVRTTRAPAALAMATGAPIVVICGWASATAFGVRASRPLDPAQHRSQEDLHQAMLDTITEGLDGDPGQLLKRFPAVELAQLMDQRRELRDQLDEQRSAHRAAQTERVAGARRADPPARGRGPAGRGGRAASPPRARGPRGAAARRHDRARTASSAGSRRLVKE